MGAALTVSPTLESRYLGTADAATYLGVTLKALYCKVDRRQVPFIKVGKTLKFDRQRLDLWMRRQAIDVPEPK